MGYMYVSYTVFILWQVAIVKLLTLLATLSVLMFLQYNHSLPYLPAWQLSVLTNIFESDKMQ